MLHLLGAALEGDADLRFRRQLDEAGDASALNLDLRPGQQLAEHLGELPIAVRIDGDAAGQPACRLGDVDRQFLSSEVADGQDPSRVTTESFEPGTGEAVESIIKSLAC